MSRRSLILIFLALPMLAQTVARPTQRAEGPEPYGGLYSVAQRADQVWQSAHEDLRKIVNDTEDPCNPVRRQLLERARRALAEKTRAYKEFYLQRGSDAKLIAEATSKILVDNEAGLRTEQDNLAKAKELRDDLAQKKTNLDKSDPEKQRLANAVQDIEKMIEIRENIILASQSTIESLQDIARAGGVRKGDAEAELERTQAYDLLMDSQNRLYESFYRARELRIGLECRRPDVPAPPPLPKE
jgi:uncharacterized protein YoxC